MALCVTGKLISQAALAFDVSYETVEYAPDLLLGMSSLDSSFVNHPRFAAGCEDGFYAFCAAAVDDLVPDDLCQGIFECLLNPLHDTPEYSFAWRVGFEVGWISARALTSPAEAQAAMVVLASLLSTLVRFGYVSASSTCIRRGRYAA